ncbi:hypothetical protein N3K66_001284 [Trichothecium roseum]|uniref:Uncharacterized protein n=1 Tax=Trichothecium roseum TaxID=47278 RepID=A0ACC0VFY9_9HYPO|nr:hypothetical protein N3K66_001284 [Trichothecium roseum]
MSPRPEKETAPAAPDLTDTEAVDLAQAYQELAKGEQAATAMEANLSNLESKLDALLAAFEAAEKDGAKPDGKAGSGDEADAKDIEEPAPADGKKST